MEGLCVVAETPEEFIAEINRLMDEDFTEEDIEERDDAMKELYQNDRNALTLIRTMLQK